MMNILALSLIATTLAGAGVWSPPSEPQNPHLVSEGSRVIVVEYERQVDDDHDSSSPPPHRLIQEAKDKFKETSSLLPNLGQGLSSTPLDQIQASPKDHDNNNAFSATKEAVESVVHKGKDKMEQTKNTLKNIAENVMHEGKEKVEETKMNVGEELKKDAMEIVRRSKRLVCNMCSYVVTPETVKTVVKVVHLLGFSMAYGSSLWVTFVSSYLLSRGLARQQFAVVQSKIYPVYFKVVAYDVVVVLVAHLVGNGWRSSSVQGWNLFAVLVLVLVNMCFFEPKATKVMLERMKMEKEEGRGRDIDDIVSEPILTSSPAATTATTTRSSPGATRMAPVISEEAIKSRMAYLNKQLKKLNTYSSLLNVVALMGLTAHLVYLARHVHLTP